jgi:hypothetical protein
MPQETLGQYYNRSLMCPRRGDAAGIEEFAGLWKTVVSASNFGPLRLAVSNPEQLRHAKFKVGRVPMNAIGYACQTCFRRGLRCTTGCAAGFSPFNRRRQDALVPAAAELRRRLRQKFEVRAYRITRLLYSGELILGRLRGSQSGGSIGGRRSAASANLRRPLHEFWGL